MKRFLFLFSILLLVSCDKKTQGGQAGKNNFSHTVTAGSVPGKNDTVAGAAEEAAASPDSLVEDDYRDFVVIDNGPGAEPDVLFFGWDGNESLLRNTADGWKIVASFRVPGWRCPC
ncbi:MAG TPA: hypothetical protein VFU15_07955 [Bacteroidia bacterium]|nr:hypothetical protein [Bacteroidia bacterium]